MKYSSVIGWHECSIEYATLIANQGYLTNSLTILSKLPSPTLHPEFSSSWLQRSRAIVLFDDLCRLVWKPPKFSHKFIGDWGTTCIDTTQPSLEHDATRIKSPGPRCLSPQYVRKTWNILRFFEILRPSSPRRFQDLAPSFQRDRVEKWKANWRGTRRGTGKKCLRNLVTDK